MPNPAASPGTRQQSDDGPQRRRPRRPRRLRPATTTRVIRAVRGPATGSSRDEPSSSANTTEARVTDRIMITMPLTVGVTRRRRMTTHLDMMSWRIAVTITRLTSVPGPPSTTAVMQNGMDTAAVNIGSRAPAPTGPMRRACIRVEIPTTIREANTIQSRYESPRPDSLATITGVTSNVAEAIRLNWAPYPADGRIGGLSSTSYRGFLLAVVVRYHSLAIAE